MKKFLIQLLIILALISSSYAEDVKITELPADTDPTCDDLVMTVDSPGSTPANRKVILQNLPKGMSLLYFSDWPVGLDLTEVSYVNGTTSPIQDQLNAEESSTSNDFDPDRLAGDTEDDDLIDAALLADLSGLYDAAGLAAAAADASIPKSILTGLGLLGGSADSTPVFVSGTDNCVYGHNSANELGCWNNFTPVLTAAPASDDTYTGTITTIVAGEALTQWNVVYSKNKAGVEAYYKYDSDAADKAEPPRCVVTPAAGIDADASGVCLTEGIVRNDGWGMTTNQDEGKKVYASTTAGGITLTEPSTDGVVIGVVREQNVIHFKFPLNQASTGSGAPVKATSPTIVSPIFSTSAQLPVDGTVDAAGEVTVDQTTDQFRYYGAAARSLPYKKTYSIVVPDVAATDDIVFVKLPYGITLVSLDCIVSAATSATINIQECTSAGASCDDMATDDLACDTDGAATTTFGGAEGAIAASGAWLKLDVASISGTPGTLTVTVTYSVIGD